MTLLIPLTIDGQALADVEFDDAFAKSAGKISVIGRNGVSFDFAADASGYLVEKGNAGSFFRRPNTTRVPLPSGKAFRLAWPAHMKAGELRATLYLNQYDNKGLRLSFTTASLDGDLITGFFARRPDATSYAFALRLMGSAEVEFGAISLAALPEDLGLADTIGGDGRIFERLRSVLASAIDERRFERAEALCELFPPQSLVRQIFRMRILVALCRYEEAARFYEAGDVRLKAQPSARGRYLRALTALGQSGLRNTVLGTAIDEIADAPVLAGLFPYLQNLDETLRQKAAAKVLAANPDDANLQVAAAQLLLSSDAVEQAFVVAENVTADAPQTRSEIALLRCNVALRIGDKTRAVRHLSEAFEAYGMEPLVLRDPSEPLSVTNVAASGAHVAVGLPKMTVIMCCFNAAGSVGTALTSLRAQTHQDIEIIVVDDCSTDNTVEVLRKAAKDDQRVIIVRQAINQGAYVARNTGLHRATGEFVLVHDSDDWAPPQKVERLARYLMGNPNLIGVRGRMVRFAAGVGAHYANGYARTDFSSFTFRRVPALTKAGYYTNVRIGADSEYAFRLQRLFGEGSVGELPELINLMAYLPQSLTTGGLFHIDIDTGVFSPLRAQYQQAYFRWHEQAQSLFIDFPNQGPLPFPVPDEMKP